MAALIDSEDFEMPMTHEKRPMFQADFCVMGVQSNDEENPARAEIWVSVPEYFAGSTMEGEDFEYDSCGLLHVDLNQVVDDFIEDYKYGIVSLDEADFLRKSLLGMARKLKAFVEKERAKK